MVALLAHYMAPIMFASLVLFLLLGYPVAFSPPTGSYSR